MSNRHTRVTEDIKREISQIIAQDVKDPRLGMLSITGVDVSRDLSYAKVFFSVLDEEQVEQTLTGLNKSKGFIRSELAKRVKIRHTPEISFQYDPSLERGARINALLKDLNVGSNQGGQES